MPTGAHLLDFTVVTVAAVDSLHVFVVHVVEADEIGVTVVAGEIAVNRRCEGVRIDVDADLLTVPLSGHIGILVATARQSSVSKACRG
jgi:hypothetical protein